MEPWCRIHLSRPQPRATGPTPPRHSLPSQTCFAASNVRSSKPKKKKKLKAHAPPSHATFPSTERRNDLSQPFSTCWKSTSKQRRQRCVQTGHATTTAKTTSAHTPHLSLPFSLKKSNSSDGLSRGEAIRILSRIYVGNLARDVTEQDLLTVCLQYLFINPSH